jgi:hypothetical protein
MTKATGTQLHNGDTTSIKKLSSYLTGNKLRLLSKAQPVNAV